MGQRAGGEVDRDAVAQWAEDFGALCRQAVGHFLRRDSRANAEGYLRGLLGRKVRGTSRTSWR